MQHLHSAPVPALNPHASAFTRPLPCQPLYPKQLLTSNHASLQPVMPVLAHTPQPQQRPSHVALAHNSSTPDMSSTPSPISSPTASNLRSNIITHASAVVAPPSSQTASASASSSKASSNSHNSPIVYISGQKAHSLHARGHEVIQSMTPWVETELIRYLKPVQKSWQPQDFLPDPASPDFEDQVMELRNASNNLPWDYLVVLVGDMVTEEALPSYMNMLNLLDGTKDESGADPTPWARWTRAWTAEENRHGDLLNKYLYLSGRVDMRSVEVTIQNLIGAGLDPKLENNPYMCFVYTSFQERATKISHGNTARLAVHHGDPLLGKMCGLIAADEGRHEAAYQHIVGEFFKRDPEGAVLAFADMMKKGIVMPAHFMNDNWHKENNNGGNLFVDYATVADSIGVYTTLDYARIVEHLVSKWKVSELRVSGEAAEAQQYLCSHSERIRRLAHLQMERRLRDRKHGRSKAASFSWIKKREIALQ